MQLVALNLSKNPARVRGGILGNKKVSVLGISFNIYCIIWVIVIYIKELDVLFVSHII